MDELRMTIADMVFDARLETDKAPRTCAAFVDRPGLRQPHRPCPLERRSRVDPARRLPVRRRLREPHELPGTGPIILYPGGISETEILLAYGGVRFASKVGQLAGNHFLTLTSGLDQLPEIGRLALWEGAKPIRFEAA